MISLSSDCCRIDSVKASANQLKRQFAQVNATEAIKAQAQSANERLQSLDAQIKSGDANKAEVALISAKAAIDQLQYVRPTEPAEFRQVDSSHYGGLSVFA